MKLRIINSIFYASIAVLGIAIISGNIYASFLALTKPWSYAPKLAWPWLWLLLALGLSGTMAFGASRMAAGRKLGLLPYALLLALTVLAASARRAAPVPQRPHPEEAVMHLLARAEIAANELYSKDSGYPLDVSQIVQSWPAQLQDMGYRQRGARRLKSRIWLQEDAIDAAYRPLPQIRPGDLVYSVDSARRRYWLTAFVLDPSGRLVAATSAGKRVLLGVGREGRPAARNDPLFPEYPNKKAL